MWVANNSDNSITKLRASDGTPLATIPGSPANGLNGPRGLAFDGANIWVTNNNAHTVSEFRASDASFVRVFTISTQAFGVAFDGANVWVTGDGGVVTELRATDGAFLGQFSVGACPNGMAFDGANIWVVNSCDGSVSKL
jgi:DNA-binding beta-propeller fold protein YncE